jgi:hypothetical protein
LEARRTGGSTRGKFDTLEARRIEGPTRWRIDALQARRIHLGEWFGVVAVSLLLLELSGCCLVVSMSFSSLFHCYLVAALCGSGRWLARTVRLVLLLHCERFGCGLLVAWLCLFCLFRKSLVSTFPLLPVLFLLLSPRFLCTRSLLVFSSHLLAFPESCSVAVAFAL